MKKAIMMVLSAAVAVPAFVLPAFAQDDKQAEEKKKPTRAERREQRREARHKKDEERREARHKREAERHGKGSEPEKD